MRFYSAIFTTASFIGAVVAQSTTVFFTETPTSVVAGQPVTLKYTAPNGPVTITLRKGSPSNLSTVQVITSGATGGTFTWTPDKTLTDASDYALEITQGTQDNFSGQLAVTGGTGTGASAASAATPATSAAASTPTTVTATVRQASSSSTGTPSGTPLTPTPSSASTRASSATTTRTATTSSATTAPSGNAAGMNSHSPVALIFGAVVAMAYLN